MRTVLVPGIVHVTHVEAAGVRGAIGLGGPTVHGEIVLKVDALRKDASM